MQRDDVRMELVAGAVFTSPLAYTEHGSIAANLTASVGWYIHHHQLGDAYMRTGFITAREPDTVLAPDIAYIQASRVPAPEPPFWGRVVPDLVAEVITAGDRITEIDAKVALWLAAGVRLVWVVWPQIRMVRVYEPPAPVQEIDDTQMLTGGAVLPGFTIPVAEIFG